MTLQDYTKFIGTFRDFNRTSEDFGPELEKLLGTERSIEFCKLLMGKSMEETERGRGTIFIHDLQIGVTFTPPLFLNTLAEFCEPLLVKETAEKPEGGQDAAKA